MAVLSQLADPVHYRPCDWDLQTDTVGRAYWDELFRWHLDAVLLPLIRAEYGDTPASVADFRREYLAAFDHLRLHPTSYDRVDILLFTEVRRRVLEAYGFEDPFHAIKRRENEAALTLLPDLLAELDAVDQPVRQELLLYGLVAGNTFDLGSKATVRSEQVGSAAFRELRAVQAQRPWLRNDAAAWWRRWEDGPPFRHVLFFVDNAGSDVLLGCLPLARWMLQAGARVTLAANGGPALNDIAAAELAPLLKDCTASDAVVDAALREGRLSVASTGNRLPLLDLTQLSERLVRATHDVDLVVLHGMGRAVESNYRAGFHCDALRTAILKDEAVAAHVRGRLFDGVFKYTPRPAKTQVVVQPPLKQRSTGHLRVICGSMFAGKTARLIEHLVTARAAGRRVVACKHLFDQRYDPKFLMTHDGRRFPAVAVASAAEILRRAAHAEVLGIDEAQFFGKSLVRVWWEFRAVGCEVLVAGIDHDAWGQPFPPLPQLVALADEVERMEAPCTVCGRPAPYSQRMVPVVGGQMVGGPAEYQPRCAAHFCPLPAPPPRYD
jgi:thymidine kinase/uncharacterized protein with ATP-grasp and redox domains